MSAHIIGRDNTARASVAAVLFSFSIFLSAALLFWVQPLVAKMLLPLLGGAPSVWNTCMVFFQATLLAGYAYALAVSKHLSLRQQGLLQLTLLAVAGLTLPFAVSQRAVQSVPTDGSPAAWLIATLFVTVGLPFFILSTNGPLLQRWFSRTDHPEAGDPYFLYSLSNAGSFISLLAFPFLLEPALKLGSQSRLWAGGYVLLTAGVLSCVVLLWGQGGRAADAHTVDQETITPSAGLRARWVLLSFIPSSLMLGVTTYISTDVASVPLVWILPLALYLLTFVLAFARRQHLSLTFVSLLIPALMVLLCFLEVFRFRVSQWMVIILHLGLFFAAALLCHRRLAQARPGVGRLPEFYFWVAAGGVLGGVFNALLAPLVFVSTAEYPLALILAALMRPRPAGTSDRRLADFAAPAAVALVTLAALAAVPRLALARTAETAVVVGAPLVLSYLLAAKRPLGFALAMLVVLAGTTAPRRGEDDTLHRARNFFGRWSVSAPADGGAHHLAHGTTAHGMQNWAAGERCEPLSYYHKEGPLGSVFAVYNGGPASPHVAVVGLGAGTTLAYSAPGQDWDVYEIDPAVVRIASDPRYFTFLTDCASAPYRIVLGDARLRLGEAPAAHYGLFVLDAFSSDSIPTHLVTRQALELYLSKLSEGGIMAFHVSNRYFDLAPLFAGLAREARLSALVCKDTDIAKGEYPSIWVAMARRREDLGALAHAPCWRAPEGDVVWTDDYSNILSLMR